MSIAIRGMEFAVPKSSFTNEDMAKIVETNDEWITQRTGIKTRRIASKEENAVSLAIEAVDKLLKSTSVDPESIDMIISATSAPERCYPSVACEVQNAIGADNAAAFDMVAACSGFLYALQLARTNVMSKLYKRILVVASDTTTKFLDWTDRSSCVLFGDGASATIVEYSEEQNDDISIINLYADGKYKELISLQMESNLCPLHGEPAKIENKHILMNGREVYKYVMKKIPTIINQTLEQAKLTIEDIDYFIPHQANMRMIEALSERLNIPQEKVLANIDKYGNMSATSIPCVISENIKSGKINKNSRLLLSAFGAGMTAACAIIKVR
jgi:3-oxoacyl-[acyl-carrier-protein] synthase-3